MKTLFDYLAEFEQPDHTPEVQDQEDTVTLDVPLLIRIMEMSREDIKTDEELHVVVDKILQLKNEGTLTMDNYPHIEQGLTSKENDDTADSGIGDIKKLAGMQNG